MMKIRPKDRKLPRLYKEAVRIVERVKDHNESVRDLIYTANKYLNKRALLAIVSETLKNEASILKILKKSKLLEKRPKLNKYVAYVLVTEYVIRQRPLPGCSPAVESVKECVKPEDFKTFANIKGHDGTGKVKYIRVNTLKESVENVCSFFKEDHWKLVKTASNDYNHIINKMKNLNEDEFMVDYHVPSLLVIPKKTDLHLHKLYLDGSIFIQNKAGCIAVDLLKPSPGSVVFDMCAAPGMKTTYLAAVMKDKGKIYAAENNPNRYQLLLSMIAKSGATCIEAVCADALTLTPEKYADIEYIMVDPTCSHTGNEEAELRPELSEEKLNSLASFQVIILKHALQFPNVKRVVYSTCSLHPRENEDVVDKVMAEVEDKFSLSSNFPKYWRNKETVNYACNSKCLKLLPERDLTIGFFAAVFERKSQCVS